MNIPDQVPVVVVGAGPTGLTLACTLRQAGVDVMVVDQAADGATTSRAAVVHARTLEVLEELEVSRRMVADGVTVPVFTIRDRDRVLARIDFSTLPTHYPYALMLPQSQTEAIVCTRLEELGGRVHRPHRATAVTTTLGVSERTEVAICGPNGDRYSTQAQYVVGADGMHSTVRQAAGIGFVGDRYPESFMLASSVVLLLVSATKLLRSPDLHPRALDGRPWSVVEVRVEDADFGDRVDWQAGGPSRSADRVDIRPVVHAEGGRVAGRHVGMDPGHTFVRIGANEGVGRRGADRVGRHSHARGEGSFDDVARHQ